MVSGSGVLNNLIDNLPFELHIPGYNYCGPGTKLQKRLARGDKGINKLDEACKNHDIAYWLHKDITNRNLADSKLAEIAHNRWNTSFTKRKLPKKTVNISDTSIDILITNTIRVTCNLIEGWYVNNVAARVIREFSPNVPPDISEKVNYDDSIESIEVHSYYPFNDNFKNNDEIRISIHQQDLIVLPCQSSIYVEGTIEKDANFVNNGPTYLFQDLRYELNGMEIDRSKNCGITSAMKGYVSYNEGMVKGLKSFGWYNDTVKDIEDEFGLNIPLSHLLGFAEDYKKVTLNMN
ncbi:hypothetical protein EVAR_20418_1 [Eumeta japonica]|uniref:Phospholipase A2-like domain-containing protein n=1 Tax=Eumeta variegata TaxID=151549 RepID=A0A4C1TXY9_EUMVA|nr:hypothetical protein EVAR_20418_1 [Eumeta japonica]